MSSSSSSVAQATSSADNKVTADSYGNVQVADVDKECWMLRVPTKLAAAWDRMPEGTVLGELVFRKGGKASNGRPAVKPSLEVQVDPQVSAAASAGGEESAATTSTMHSSTPLPLQYSLQAMTKKLPTLHPITRRPNGSIQVHGTVTRTGNLQVHQDANYRQLCKTRILQSTVHNSRYVKPVDSNQVAQQSQRKSAPAGATNASSSSRGFGDSVHKYGKRLLEQANHPPSLSGANKKPKFTPDQTTKSILFQLFSQTPYWTVKDLKVATGGRPEAEIRDTLREIGDYHRSGDHKNAWELRHEFQNTSIGNTDTNTNGDGTNTATATASGGAGADGNA
jgi:hypothetical protein